MDYSVHKFESIGDVSRETEIVVHVFGSWYIADLDVVRWWGRAAEDEVVLTISVRGVLRVRLRMVLTRSGP